jgi:SAM-dependent methyltransferase
MQMNTAHHTNLLWRFDRGLSLKEAIFATVKDGDIVVDAGCGTGILSIWAAKAGAQRVLAIDSGDIGIGENLAKENRVSDQIRFIQADLSDFELPDNELCDVLLGMVYFNDPRRDTAQAVLTSKLRNRLLHPNGSQIPDRVVYTACPIEWLNQDINTRFAEIDKKVGIMEQKYGLALGTIREAAKQVPDRDWFPLRRSSGFIDRDNARLLSHGEDVFAEIDYTLGFQGYPEQFKCSISQPGICNILLFSQALYAGSRLIFSNESISWIRNPLRVEPGAELQFALDKNWVDTNVVTMEKA